jgi:hypothetical protein
MRDSPTEKLADALGRSDQSVRLAYAASLVAAPLLALVLSEFLSGVVPVLLASVAWAVGVTIWAASDAPHRLLPALVVGLAAGLLALSAATLGALFLLAA